MPKVPSRQQKEELLALWIERWKPRLLLDRWAIIPTFAERDLPPRVDGTRVLAEMSVGARYTDARLTIYPHLWLQPRRVQETTIIHELAHILTEPIRDLLERAVAKGVITNGAKEDVWEALTEDIAKVTAKAYMKGQPKGYHL